MNLHALIIPAKRAYLCSLHRRLQRWDVHGLYQSGTPRSVGGPVASAQNGPHPKALSRKVPSPEAMAQHKTEATQDCSEGPWNSHGPIVLLQLVNILFGTCSVTFHDLYVKSGFFLRFVRLMQTELRMSLHVVLDV